MSFDLDLQSKKRSRVITFLFLGGLSLLHLVFWISLRYSDGLAMNYFVYNSYSSSFSDYFRAQVASMEGNAYFNGYTVFSPLCMLLYSFTSIFTKSDIYAYPAEQLPYYSDAMLPVIMFNVLIVAAAAVILYQVKKGAPAIKAWFTLLFVVSAPVIFLLERGNISVLALVFIMLFLALYENDKKYCREISYICLALACSVNLLAIVFVILLLKKKSFAASGRTALYTAALYIIPSFAFNGFRTIHDIIENAVDAGSRLIDVGIANRADIIGGLNAVSLSLGNGLIESKALTYILWGILVAGLIAAAFISKSKWRVLFALSLILTAAPFYSFTYSIIFLIIPVTAFLDTDEERKTMDFIYLILFILVFAPIAFNTCILNFSENKGFDVTLYSYISTISVLIMVVLIFIEAVTLPLEKIEFSKKKREARALKEAGK